MVFALLRLYPSRDKLGSIVDASFRSTSPGAAWSVWSRRFRRLVCPTQKVPYFRVESSFTCHRVNYVATSENLRRNQDPATALTVFHGAVRLCCVRKPEFWADTPTELTPP